jgi:Rrf2 family cysteine metabolism transcriptional repressor
VFVQQKSRYALRAIFELAKRGPSGPTKISDLAEAQAIPARFLEVILGQLKGGAFVESRRGSEGGYVLLRDPHGLTVGEVLRFVQGPFDPVDCMGERPRARCALSGDCVFMPMWEDVRKAVSGVFESTTFQDLLDREARRARGRVVEYSI